MRRERRTLLEPARDCFECVLAYRHYSRLAAFAEHPHGAIATVEVAEVQADELGETQPGRIEQLHDRFVTQTQLRVRAEFQQPRHEIDVHRVGQAFARFRRLHAYRRIRVERALAKHEVEEAAQSAQPPLNRARRRTLAELRRREHAHVLTIHAAPVADIVTTAVADEPLQIAAIADIGVRREPAFDRKMRQKARQPRARFLIHGLRRSPQAVPIASLTRSPMRARNSVLIVGWKRSASGLPIASSAVPDDLLFSPTLIPSGTSAAEPISTVPAPNR